MSRKKKVLITQVKRGIWGDINIDVCTECVETSYEMMMLKRQNSKNTKLVSLNSWDVLANLILNFESELEQKLIYTTLIMVFGQVYIQLLTLMVCLELDSQTTHH